MKLLCSRLDRIIPAAMLAAFLGWALTAPAALAQTTYSGQAGVILITDSHNPPGGLTLCDTGPLPSTGGSLSQSISNYNQFEITIDTASATAVGAGAETTADTAITNMTLVLEPPSGGTSLLSVNFVGCNATATAKNNGTAALSASTNIQGLVLNGQAIVVTGKPNQIVNFPGGQITLNEQTVNGNEITVVAMRIVETGCMNGIFGYARAGITAASAPPPENCGKLTGGGWIVGTPSGAKGTFAVGGGIRQGQFWGHLEYIDHSTGMNVHATDVTGFTIDPSTPNCATITYNVNINGTPGATATVIACDNGEPGRDDTFDITLSTGYHASGDLGGASPGGGNIQMHKCPPGWLK